MRPTIIAGGALIALSAVAIAQSARVSPNPVENKALPYPAPPPGNAATVNTASPAARPDAEMAPTIKTEPATPPR